jgi:hypothetical protein
MTSLSIEEKIIYSSKNIGDDMLVLKRLRVNASDLVKSEKVLCSHSRFFLDKKF